MDYISKPVSPPVVRARVCTHLAIQDQNRVLEERVRARTHQLAQMQDLSMVGLATLAEYRDNETGEHILRTRDYVRLLAGHLLDHPRFRDELDREVIELMVKSTPLHDVGKVAVPDAILLKPGKLTAGEFERMKLHTVHGRDAIRSTEEVLDGSAADSFLRYARQVAYSHHERWDGAGYPEGLAGEEIPLCARLMAVADVYDALISKRVYKPPFPQSRVLAIMEEGRGSHFDPDVTDAFFELRGRFKEVALEHADHEEERQALLEE